VYLFRPSLGFLAEAQPRLEIDEDIRHFLSEMYITFFRRPHELQSKKITNFIVFVISLPTKREIYYLQYNYVLIYW
jgi:hypothetical protein